MLDKETKRIIDNARDVLVGKVPNPLSQIDLITTAMIYKFMDDMDLSNISFGGERIFFTGEFEKYAWSKLLSSTVGNNDRLNLYAEALDKLPYAKQIPQLFRNIFKDAFLPFRDGATLTMFLKEINNLSYDDSENLGDAFEYLLSIMSSQGDAGQFRTPRHIIDFIVEVVNPTKTDTILDPACGTSGFLISAYKHILHQSKQDKKPLSIEEIKQITNSIEGYDIDPTMVKLSLVNLYLHKFTNPKIYEYDSLSSDDRWGDKFDVILANPPFMTPKGGIRPHNKFGIKANRSEVLFVDYFMEHLTLNGKAGFVVPEGIIFQSATAYKSLRKMMVEDKYLYAVVSLPAGVFNPYSGVKTSILFFDRELAKKTDKILFVDIKNDGYDLGAQRRPIKENDLPSALQFIQEYQKSYNQDLTLPSNCLLVEKSKIAENGEYNLTASRYKQSQDLANSKWEMVKLGEIIKRLDVRQLQANELEKISQNNGPIKLLPSSANYDWWANEDPSCVSYTGEVITLGQARYANIKYYKGKFISANNNIYEVIDNKKVSLRYIFLVLKENTKRFYTLKAQYPSFDKKTFDEFLIPLPPLEVQEKIVKELEGYQAIIDGAQKVVDNWKPIFTINPNWEKVKIEQLFTEIKNGKNVEQIDEPGQYKVSRIQTISDGTVDLLKIKYTNDTVSEKDFLNKGDILLSHINSFEHLAKSAIFNSDEKVVHGVNLIKFSPDRTKIIPEYAAYYFKRNEFIKTAKSFAQRAVNQASIKTTDLKNIEIFVPSLEEQESIVAKIEQEEQYVDSCKKLIELNKQKISDKIHSIWNSDKDE